MYAVIVFTVFFSFHDWKAIGGRQLVMNMITKMCVARCVCVCARDEKLQHYAETLV
jgi:hypothetical protein